MKQDLLNFIENKLHISDLALKTRLEDLASGQAYPQRSLYSEIQSYTDNFLRNKKDPRWICISGLRGVGKSTLLAQIYSYLRADLQIPLKQILYFSVDEIVENLDSSIYEFISTYEQIEELKIEELEHMILLLDEVHYDAKWSASLKTLYDRYPNLFIICTGSSSLDLHTNGDELRRIQFEQLLPLTFSQFLTLSDSSFALQDFTPLQERLNASIRESGTALELYQNIKKLEPELKALIDKISLNFELKDRDFDSSADKFAAIFMDYLCMGSFPFALDLMRFNPYSAYHALENSISKILNIDLEHYDRFRIPKSTIKKLLYKIAISSEAISLETFSSDLGITKTTVTEILDALEQASLISKYLPRSRKHSKLRKANKFLFSSPSLRAAVLHSYGADKLVKEHKGNLLEDYFNLYYQKEFGKTNAEISHWSTDKSVDFSIDLNHKEIPVEVSFAFKDSSQVNNSYKNLDLTSSPYALVFCKRKLELDEQSVFIPWQYLALL